MPSPARPGDKDIWTKWGEINGNVQWLWRAVDQHNQTLAMLIQKRRTQHAAKRFFKRLLKGLRDVPRVIITDKLHRYGAARKEILPGVEHRQHKGLNHQAAISHQPKHQQERQMHRFKSAGQAQRFLSVRARANTLFRPRRNRLKAAEYRIARDRDFQTWQQVTCAHIANLSTAKALDHEVEQFRG